MAATARHYDDDDDDDDGGGGGGNNNNNNNNNNVIPIVKSSTGVVPKSPPQSITRLNLHPNTYIQLQKSVILGTYSIVRNFLNYK